MFGTQGRWFEGGRNAGRTRRFLTWALAVDRIDFGYIFRKLQSTVPIEARRVSESLEICRSAVRSNTDPRCQASSA
jgi:hypothetical protein